jgi:uncharacterized membrane protein
MDAVVSVFWKARSRVRSLDANRSALLATIAIVLGLAGPACGDDAGANADAGAITDADVDANTDASADTAAVNRPSADCEDRDIPAFVDVQAFERCLGCHATALTGDARNEAPPGVNFDDYDSAAAMAERAAQYVFLDIMPPPAAGIRMSEAEKQQLYRWALCGTPE